MRRGGACFAVKRCYRFSVVPAKYLIQRWYAWLIATMAQLTIWISNVFFIFHHSPIFYKFNSDLGLGHFFLF